MLGGAKEGRKGGIITMFQTGNRDRYVITVDLWYDEEIWALSYYDFNGVGWVEVSNGRHGKWGRQRWRSPPWTRTASPPS